jgi:ribonuclease P protein component
VNRRFRLTKSNNFKRVRRYGKSHAHPLIVLIALPNQDGITRFGVAAGRTVGNAVQRNHAKRLLRHAIQQVLPIVRPGWDIVLIARRTITEATFQQIVTALANMLGRAKHLQEAYDIKTAARMMSSFKSRACVAASHPEYSASFARLIRLYQATFRALCLQTPAAFTPPVRTTVIRPSINTEYSKAA